MDVSGVCLSPNSISWKNALFRSPHYGSLRNPPQKPQPTKAYIKRSLLLNTTKIYRPTQLPDKWKFLAARVIQPHGNKLYRPKNWDHFKSYLWNGTKCVVRINVSNALTTPIQSRYGAHSEGRQNINIIRFGWNCEGRVTLVLGAWNEGAICFGARNGVWQ